MSEINPYEAPPEWDAADPEVGPLPTEMVDETGHPIGVWRRGSILIMHRKARLPDRCVKTNQPTTDMERWQHTYTWCHWAILLSILISPLITVILYLVCRGQAKIVLSVCQRQLSRRYKNLILGWAMVLGGFGGFFYFMYYFITELIIAHADNGDPNPLFFLLALGAFVIAIAGIIWVMTAAPILSAKYINKYYVWFKGVHPDYLDMLPEWPGE